MLYLVVNYKKSQKLINTTVTSHEFLDKFNSSLCLDDQAPSCSSNTTHKSSSTNRSSRKGQHEHVVPTLTADMLKRSQRDREAMVPAGTTRFVY